MSAHSHTVFSSSRNLLRSSIALALALCAWNVSATAAEVVDTTFNANAPAAVAGWRGDYFSSVALNEETVAVARTADGGYLTAGRYANPNGVAGAGTMNIGLIKYQHDGAPAAGFGSNVALGSVSNGWLTYDAGLTDVTDMQLDSQGRIVVVGPTPFGGNGSNFGVARFLADGSGVDLNFHGQGGNAVAFDLGGSMADTPVAAYIDVADAVVVLGSVTGATSFADPVSHTEVGLTRLHADGSLDLGFGDNGVSHTPYIAGFDVRPVGFARTAAGYVVAATANLTFDQTAIVAMYFDASGIYKHKLTLAMPGNSYSMQAVAIATVPDSASLIIAGNMQYSPGQAAVACRITIDASGVLAQDASFGPVLSGCTVSADVDVATGVAVASDQSIVMIGEKRYGNGIFDGVITRLHANGTLDSFFANARAPTHLQTLSWRTHFSRVLLDREQPVIVGYRADSDSSDADHDFVAVRYLSDLIFANGFGH